MNLFNSLGAVWFELRHSVRGTGQRTKHSSSPDTENVLLPSAAKFNFSTDVLCKYNQVSFCLLLPEHLCQLCSPILMEKSLCLSKQWE